MLATFSMSAKMEPECGNISIKTPQLSRVLHNRRKPIIQKLLKWLNKHHIQKSRDETFLLVKTR